MPTLSIIVPLFNEERTIAAICDALHNLCPDAELIFVDDGSRDQSLSRLHTHIRPSDIVLTKENGGKGSAIRLGLTRASGTYTIIQDADLEYDPGEISLLLAHAIAHPGHAVFGSRFLKKNPNLYKRFLWGNKAITLFINMLFKTKLTDTYTCYKLFPTDVMRSLPLKANGFELETELCCYPALQGIPIDEIPISYSPRSLEEGKKIRLRDAWRGCVTALGIRYFCPLSRILR